MFEGIDSKRLLGMLFDENPNISFLPPKSVNNGKDNALNINAICRESSEIIDPWDDRINKWNDLWDSMNYRHKGITK